MPSHLDGFELAFIGSSGVALEVGQFCDVTRSVKRTVRGSRSGCTSLSRIPISSASSQVRDFGMEKFLKVSRFQSFQVSKP
jgi:hypothetical protein